MNKNIAILLSLALTIVFAACTGDDEMLTPAATTQNDGPVIFELTATRPAEFDAATTRAVKQDWEAGDAIFVFFSNIAAPKHLKMTYDGSAWTTTEYDGDTPSAGCLGLTNGMSGTMRAVFLPFGSNATVSADGTSFKFSTTYYSYYATATLAYTVMDNRLRAGFIMRIPTDWVQFFVADASATDEAYNLDTDAVNPTAIASIAADGTIVETQRGNGQSMPGYAYGGGYLFSGKRNNSYGYQYNSTFQHFDGNYYFAKTRVSDGQRCDFFAPGKTLASYSAVKLPDNSDEYYLNEGWGVSNFNGKWIPVGPNKAVIFRSSEAIWLYTCNYGQSVPEAKGSFFTSAPEGVNIPTTDEANFLVNSCSHAWLSVHGVCGMVCSSGNNFIFLPSVNQFVGFYMVESYWYIALDRENKFILSPSASVGGVLVRGVKR